MNEIEILKQEIAKLREELEEMKENRDMWMHDATESRKRLVRYRSERNETFT